MEKRLEGTPRPHYLEGVEEVSSDGQQFRGVVVFPSSDLTIADRVDHVNVAHHLFAVWNAAHVMCQQAGFINPRAFRTEAISRRPTIPDKQISLEVVALLEREDSKKVSGLLTATFTDGKKELCKVMTQFVAQRAC